MLLESDIVKGMEVYTITSKYNSFPQETFTLPVTFQLKRPLSSAFGAYTAAMSHSRPLVKSSSYIQLHDLTVRTDTMLEQRMARQSL
jgi:hypothetical protein